jgi:DmsE family decaheme c-type cytochrome
MKIRRGPAPFAAAAILATLSVVALGAAARQEAAATPAPTPAAATTPAPAAATPAAAATTPAAAPAAETTPKAAEALPKCGDCHTAEVAAFAKNPHARWSHKDKKPDPEDACSTCHGDGTKHIEAGGDPTLIQTFKGLSGAENCLACHDKDKVGWHQSFTTGFHSNTEAVNCLTCHSIHKPDPKSAHLVVKPSLPLCGTCHATIASSFENKPYHHRLDRGGMSCVDCHDPHASRDAPVRLTREGDLPCLSCHSEKRGPFVFDHVTGSAGNCLSCHEAHGSNNPRMLNWARVDQLCLSCHSQTGGPKTAGAQPPSFHDLTLPRYRNCTTCHVAIHGSNLSETFLK